jgi:CHAD domain-containing protein
MRAMAKNTVVPERSGTRAVRRAAHHYIKRAAKALASPRLSDADVHAARKDLKKSRASLRLLRSALGDAVYHHENSRLRDAARPLTEVRDGKILVQGLDTLQRRYPELRRNPAALRLGKELHQTLQGAERHLRDRAGELQHVRRALEKSEQRARRWHVGKHGWSKLGPALERLYRAGRRAARGAEALGDDTTLHEWRKQAKYLAQALRILEPVEPKALGLLAQQALTLAECLGSDHDLSLLRARVAKLERGNGKAAPAGASALVRLIDRRRMRLQARARQAGASLYAAPPRAFSARLKTLWQQWRGRA